MWFTENLKENAMEKIERKNIRKERKNENKIELYVMYYFYLLLKTHCIYFNMLI